MRGGDAKAAALFSYVSCERVGWMFTLTATAYNLVRPPKLVEAAA